VIFKRRKRPDAEKEKESDILIIQARANEDLK
jgi:hypothetical protein